MRERTLVAMRAWNGIEAFAFTIRKPSRSKSSASSETYRSLALSTLAKPTCLDTGSPQLHLRCSHENIESTDGRLSRDLQGHCSTHKRDRFENAYQATCQSFQRIQCCKRVLADAAISSIFRGVFPILLLFTIATQHRAYRRRLYPASFALASVPH